MESTLSETPAGEFIKWKLIFWTHRKAVTTFRSKQYRESKNNSEGAYVPGKDKGKNIDKIQGNPRKAEGTKTIYSIPFLYAVACKEISVLSKSHDWKHPPASLPFFTASAFFSISTRRRLV